MKIKINKMPDKKTLEKFLSGLFQRGKVLFNLKKGEFEEEK